MENVEYRLTLNVSSFSNLIYVYIFYAHIQVVPRLKGDSTCKNASSRKNKIFSLKPSFADSIFSENDGFNEKIAFFLFDRNALIAESYTYIN